MTILKTAGSAFAVTLILGTGAAFAKAHDQGVADGFPTPQPTTGGFIQSLGGNGVSSLQNKGKRGEISSEAKGDTRVEPVVGNGANSSSN